MKKFLIVLSLLISFLLGAVVMYGFMETSYISLPQPLVKSEELDKVSEIISIKVTNKVGPPKEVFTLKQTVPLSWKAINEGIYNFDIGDLRHNRLFSLRYLAVPPDPFPDIPYRASGSENKLSPLNGLDFYDVTEWKKESSTYHVEDDPYFITAQAKQAYLKAIKEFQTEDFSSLIKLCLEAKKFYSFDCEAYHPIKLETSDNKLHGYAALTPGHNKAFSPLKLKIYLIGEFEGKEIYGEGWFHIFDETYNKIHAEQKYDKVTEEMILKTRTNELPPDTQKIIEKILKVVQSTTIDFQIEK